jgi:16S rRNA (cytosine967-C5)-methyltransferase
MRMLDFAAGAGGKALALAGIMRNEGEIVATDIRSDSLAELERRAMRAGVTIIQTAPKPEGVFDVVLLDAPCSGTGTWRRQPELRWRLTPERLEELKATQDALLVQAAEHVKAGGRLVYATCSILPSENEDRVAGFLESQREFAVVPASNVWRESVGTPPPPNLGPSFHASPHSTQTDGFFTAILERNA